MEPQTALGTGPSAELNSTRKPRLICTSPESSVHGTRKMICRSGSQATDDGRISVLVDVWRLPVQGRPKPHRRPAEFRFTSVALQHLGVDILKFFVQA